MSFLAVCVWEKSWEYDRQKNARYPYSLSARTISAGLLRRLGGARPTGRFLPGKPLEASAPQHPPATGGATCVIPARRKCVRRGALETGTFRRFGGLVSREAHASNEPQQDGILPQSQKRRGDPAGAWIGKAAGACCQRRDQPITVARLLH